MSESVIDIPNEAGWPERTFDRMCSTISRGTAPVYVEHSDVLAIGQRCVTALGFDPAFARPHSSRAMGNVLKPAVGDVLLNSTGTGTIGRSCVFDSTKDFIVDGHVTLLRSAPDQFRGEWLDAVLRSSWAQNHLERFCYAGSTNQIELSRTELAATSLPVPSIDEQNDFVRIFRTLDRAIRKTEAMVLKLKQAKRGLQHDLLTRGVDSNGALRPSYKQEPNRYKPSPLGWIPMEWTPSVVEDEFVVDSGITLGQHRVPRSKPRPYLRVANVHRANLHLTDIAFLEASASEAIEKSLQEGDLLVVEGHANTNEIGRCAMADKSVSGFLFQNHLFRLRPRRLLNSYALHWMNSEFAQAYWRTEAATSSGLNTINRTKLNMLGVAVPKTDEQERISITVQNMDIRIHGENSILEKLQSQKIGLMDDLLTGRVRVTPLLAQ